MQSQPALEAVTDSNLAAPHGAPARVRAAFLALALGALWFVCCRSLSAEWTFNEQYNYGWFVPFFAAYLFWLRWEDRPEPQVRSRRSGVRGQKSETRGAAAPGRLWIEVRNGRRGLIVALTGIPILFLLLPVRLFEIANPDWRPISWLHAIAAVLLTLLAIWYAGGTPWLRHFAFPVMFILVAVPWVSAIEGPVVQALMRAVASTAAETVALFGIPAQVQGNIIRVSNGVVGVNEACSGVRSLQTSLMIGLLFGELKRLMISRRLALLAAAVAIALTANFFRALFLVSIAARENLAAVSKWHDLAGYAIVALVFIGCLAITAWLSRGQKSDTGGQTSEVKNSHSAIRGPQSDFHPQFSSTTRHSLCIPTPVLIGVLGWLLLVEAAVESWYRAHERNMPPVAGWNIHWPENEPGFRQLPISDGVRSTLRFDQGREVTWNLSDSPNSRCFLFFFRWGPGGSSVLRARAHRPDICLPSAGWRVLEDAGVHTFRVNEKLALLVRRVDFTSANGTAVAHTFFCLQEDRRTNERRTDLALPPGVQPDWSFPARWRAVRDGVRNMGQQVLEIVIISTQPTSKESAETQFEQILPKLIEGTNAKEKLTADL